MPKQVDPLTTISFPLDANEDMLFDLIVRAIEFVDQSERDEVWSVPQIYLANRLLAAFGKRHDTKRQLDDWYERVRRSAEGDESAFGDL